MNTSHHSKVYEEGRRIDFLLQLLSDPDKTIAKNIQERLLEIGKPALPFLQEAKVTMPSIRERIEAVIEDIEGEQIEKDFLALLSNAQGEVNLEAGAFLIARTAYPCLQIEAYVMKLDRMADEMLTRLSPLSPPTECLTVLNRYLFDEQGFHGNIENYYDPENSFLNRVLDRRTGIPISLSVLFLLIGRRVGLSLVGVGMPGHFVVKLEARKEQIFIDCFHGGALLKESDCQRLLRENGYGFQANYLQPTPNRLVLGRMLRNLVWVYHQRQELHRANRLSRYLKIFESDQNDSC